MSLYCVFGFFGQLVGGVNWKMLAFSGLAIALFKSKREASMLLPDPLLDGMVTRKSLTGCDFFSGLFSFPSDVVRVDNNLRLRLI
jgi:hypothetical protein